MSVSKVYPNGIASVTVAASDKLVVKSLGGEVKVYITSDVVGMAPVKYLSFTVADGATTTTAAYSVATAVEIQAGAGGAEYAAGTEGGLLKDTQAAPNALNTTGAITAAMLIGGILTSTTAAAVTGTPITGAELDAAVQMSVDDSFDLSIIATGANAFTLDVSSGITIVGTAVVATVTSGLFRFRKTAANTFVAYRIG